MTDNEFCSSEKICACIQKKWQTFHKVVQQHIQSVAGFLMTTVYYKFAANPHVKEFWKSVGIILASMGNSTVACFWPDVANGRTFAPSRIIEFKSTNNQKYITLERQVKHSSVRFEHNDMIRIRSYRSSKIIITVNNHWLKHLQWLMQLQTYQDFHQ